MVCQFFLHIITPLLRWIINNLLFRLFLYLSFFRSFSWRYLSGLCCSCIGEAELNEAELPSNEKVCHCGRHTKSRSQQFCVVNESNDKATRCPCVRKGQLCSKRCRCLNCKNKPSSLSDVGRGQKPPKVWWEHRVLTYLANGVQRALAMAPPLRVQKCVDVRVAITPSGREKLADN